MWTLRTRAFEGTEAHGFAWLDDLAAVGTIQAAREARAQDWTAGVDRALWPGRGPGWTADLIRPRLIRWINHATDAACRGRGTAQSAGLFPALSAQTVFLAKRWQKAAPGLPRFEALTGVISAGLALDRNGGAWLARLSQALAGGLRERTSTPRAAFRRGTLRNCWKC